MKVLVLAATLLSSCAPKGTPVAQSCHTDSIPEAVYRSVQFSGLNGGMGWATPIGLNRLMTAAHLLEASDCGTWTTESRKSGHACALWKNKKRDVALLAADDEDRDMFPVVQIAKELPPLGSEVFARFYLRPGSTPVVGRGRLVGTDSDGDLHVDIALFPGASGSALFDARGRAIAVVAGGMNQSAGFDSPIPTLEEVLRVLRIKSNFRGMVIATPVVGGLEQYRE